MAMADSLTAERDLYCSSESDMSEVTDQTPEEVEEWNMYISNNRS